MTHAADRRLDTGDRFPQLSLTTTAGQALTCPADLSGSWSVILFYRGHW